MCSICLSNPCSPRCPNAKESEPICICRSCRKGIHEGDQYLDLYDGPICRDCLDEMTVGEVLELVGFDLTTAERNE